MTVTTQEFLFSFVFTRYITFTKHITYFMANSFYACLAPRIVVGVLLTGLSLDPEYKTTAVFQMYTKKKKVFYSSQYCNCVTVTFYGK